MKILLINNYHFRHGGSETVYFNTADLLREHGHEVFFFSLKREENVPCLQSSYFCEAIDFKSKGFFNKAKGAVRYFYNKKASCSLEEFLKKNRPDVAHVHLLWGGLSVSVLKKLHQYNIPIVHSVHDYRMVCPAYTFKDGNNQVCESCAGGKFWHCIKKKCSKNNFVLSLIMSLEMYYRNFNHHPVRYIDEFIFVSRFCRDIHLKCDRHFRCSNNTVLYNFCNSDVIKKFDDNLDTYNNYYLYYGRLSFEKGLKTLICAFSHFPHLKLKIVGSGPEEDKLKNLCTNMKLKNVDFLGFKKGQELYDIIQNAKFVCVPSEWYENNPMTIVEAYSLKTPVIGAAIGGITEIVVEGKTGYLHKSGCVDDLCSKLALADNLNRKDYNSLKVYSKSFSEANFNRDQYYLNLFGIYTKVINLKKKI